MKSRLALAVCAAFFASPALANPLSIDTQVARITGYEGGGCFLVSQAPATEETERLCLEYSWVLSNDSAAPLRNIEISNDFTSLVARHDTSAGAAQILDLRVSEASGMRAESFENQVLVAVADYIPASGSAALRVRVEIERPTG
tara:strand:+ start:507 stop:938 length:432 start_codon:yes stop_codon:yes gene_type:complete